MLVKNENDVGVDRLRMFVVVALNSEKELHERAWPM